MAGLGIPTTGLAPLSSALPCTVFHCLELPCISRLCLALSLALSCCPMIPYNYSALKNSLQTFLVFHCNVVDISEHQ